MSKYGPTGYIRGMQLTGAEIAMLFDALQQAESYYGDVSYNANDLRLVHSLQKKFERGITN